MDMLTQKNFVRSDGQYYGNQTPAIPRLGFVTAEPWQALLTAGLVLGAFWFAARILEPRPSHRHRRRRYTAAAVSYTDKEYVSVRDGWRCTYCGQRVTRRTRHIDHSVSRANGGTNHVNNLRLACAPCNLGKGALSAREFVRSFAS